MFIVGTSAQIIVFFFTGTRRALSYSEEREKSLPGVIMAASPDVFRMLFLLADFNDTEV